MRNLVLALAGVALVAQAHAADDMSWKHAGEVRIRHTNTTNSTGVDNPKVATDTNKWEQRTHISLTGMKGENLTGHVTLSNAQNWGRDIAGGDAVGNITQANSKNNVNLLESYIWWKTNDMFSMRTGRGMFNMADGAVVSPNMYEQIPTTFDGVLGTFDFGFMGLNVFGVKGAELGESTPTYNTQTALAYDKEQNFYGFSADFKNLPDMIKMANVHLIKESQDYQNAALTADATAATANKDWLRFGLTVGGDWMNLDYKATYANLSGKRKALKDDAVNSPKEMKTDAYMLDLGAGYSLPDMMKLRIGAKYHMDSGDNDGDSTDRKLNTNNTYDGFHVDKKKYLPNTRVITALGNLTYWGLDVSLEPMENTTVGLEYTSYSRSSDKAEVANAMGAAGAQHLADTASDFTNPNTAKGLGSEFSLLAGHKYSEAFNIDFRYSMWTFGDYFKKTDQTEFKRQGINQWFVSGTLRF